MTVGETSTQTAVEHSRTNHHVAGLISLTVVSLAAGGIVAGSFLAPAPATKSPLRQPLPISLGAPDLACPGPETLAVPAGAKPVAAPGPVWISALTGSDRGLAVAGIQAYGKGSQLAVKAAGQAQTSDRMRITASDVPAKVGSLALGKLGPVVVGAQNRPGADPAPQLAGMQSTLARYGDLRGLAAASCAAPAASSWLVGGGTKAGERLRLLLSNPLQTPAVVDVEVHGPQGLVQAPSGDGVVVPARGTTVLYVDALAPGLERTAVHVTARSGRVAAIMHDALLRGLDPGGTEDISASARPGTRQVIPGVALAGGYGTGAGDPGAAGSTSIRIAVPGAEEAVARVRLVDSAGTVNLPRGAVVNVPAGGVSDVAVSGVPSKTYTAIVESDVPVVASARVGRADPMGGPPAAEFAWAASATTVTGRGYVVLPRGAESILSLAAADEAASVQIREVMASGDLGPVQPVQLNSGTSVAARLSDQAVALQVEQGDGGAVNAALVATAADPRGPLITIPQVRIAAATQPRSSAVSDPRLGLAGPG